MAPGRTIEKKGDTGVQDKDGKTAQGGSMTRQQAEQEMEQLRKVFPSVRMLTAEQVQAGEAVGDAARQHIIMPPCGNCRNRRIWRLWEGKTSLFFSYCRPAGISL